MKVAIIGSRNFNDYQKLKDFIQKNVNVNEIELIISGGENGADTLGEIFANEFKIKKLIFKPEWEKFGRRAGFVRNKDIIENCDVVFAFWIGGSKGTEHSLKLAENLNKTIYLQKF